MRQRAAEKMLRALVDHAVPGARIFFPRTPGFRAGLSWNGKNLRPTGLTLESQLHEIAHVLVAAPARRSEPEFGLGPDPYRRMFVPVVAPKEEADREEADACKVQLLLAGLLGLDEAAVMLEVHVAPLSLDEVEVLRRRYPWALPDAMWARAVEHVASRPASYGVEACASG